MKEIVRRCHVVVYVVMGVAVVASGSSPSAYIRGLIRRIDRGDPNVCLLPDVILEIQEKLLSTVPAGAIERLSGRLRSE